MAQRELVTLIRHVAWRQRIASAGSRFWWFAVSLAGAGLVWLLISRLLGLLPFPLSPVYLIYLPGLALLAALACHHQPSADETARLIDTRMHTHDLFLTLTFLPGAAGRYGPVVERQAQELGNVILPAQVLPFQWTRKTQTALLAYLLLLCGVLFLPQFDPFSKEEQRQKKAEAAQRLADSRKATQMRKALLEKRPQGKNSPLVKKELDELLQTLSTVKPRQKAANLKRFSAHQKSIASLWRKEREAKLRDAMTRMQGAQSFGAFDHSDAQQWMKQLQQGDTSGIRREISRLKAQAGKIGKMTDQAEQQKAKRELAQALRRLASFLDARLSSPALDSALHRALQQLGMATEGRLSADAMEGLQESLNLADLELEALAQALQDFQDLEQALKALQMAKRLNALGVMDGEALGKLGGLQAYIELYAQMLAQGQGEGTGLGMGGPGTGEGNIAPEDIFQATDFKPEKSTSPLGSGKMLLQWKTQELAPSGEAQQQYLRHVRTVKQGVSEAILQEQIPPGYHESIKKYFDTMEKEADGAAE